MLDPILRRWMDPPLNSAGAWLAQHGVTANAASLGGLAIGLLAVPLIAYGRHDGALVAILLNRLVDGLDGAIARHSRASALGGYLDIMCDMVFYAAVPVGFALASPGNALWSAILLASFVCTASSFLGRAIVAVQRGEPYDGSRGRKSFFHAAGIVEGTETVIAFGFFCLFPASFPWLAGLFALLCFWTAAARVLDTYRSGLGPPA